MKLESLLDRHPFDERIPVRLFHALSNAELTAAVDAATGRTFTWADLARRARAVAGALADAGVRPGDRVAWSAPTSVDAIAIWMGVAELGAIDVGIGDALQGPLLEHVLADCDPVCVITHHEAERGLGTLSDEALAGFKAVLHIGPADSVRGNAVTLDLETATGPAGEPDLRDLRPEMPATIIYTSGTTGPSKGVVLCHHHQFFTGGNLAEQFRVSQGATLYHYSPFNHVSGRQLVVAAMLTGSTLIMRSRFSPARFWEDINAHGVTHAITLGSAVPLLMDRSDSRNEGSLQYVWASPAMPKLYAEFAERFALRVCSPYGSSEVGIVVEPGVIPVEPGPPGNCGKASRFFDMAIVDDRDRILPAGEIGEIVVRPKLPWTTFLGYHGRPDAVADRTANLWYHSGDLARMDEDGYLFFVDRKQDFMRCKGENISSSELEQILVRHPDVADCAVVPVEVEEFDAEVLVALAPSGDVAQFDAVAFFRWSAEQVPHYMVPRYVRVLEDLPRGQSGKIEKHKLRKAGRAAGTWDARAHGLRATRRGVVEETTTDG